MKDLAKILNTYFEFAQHLDLNKAIATFEKSLLTELSLVQEKRISRSLLLILKITRTLMFLKFMKN